MSEQSPSNDPFAVDLLRSVVPISGMAPALAALIRRSREERHPIVITQKGSPTAVLLALDLFEEMRQMVDPTRRSPVSASAESEPESEPSTVSPDGGVDVDEAPAPRARRGRKPKMKD